MIDGMNNFNIKQENYKSKAYSSKIRNKNYKPNSASNTELLKNSIHQVIRNPEDILEKNFGTIKTGFSLINSKGDAIIYPDNGENDSNYDLGTQTVIKTRNALAKSSRTVKKSIKTAQTATKIARKSVNASKKAVQTTIKSIHTAKAAVKLLANPVTLKIIIIVAIVAFVLIAATSAISSVTGIFSSLTFTSKTNDLNNTYIFITELDTNLQHEINNVESTSKWSSIDNFHYYTNFGRLKSVNSNSIRISTDTTKLIAYLTSKYDDFSFESVKDEIKTIHQQLYDISYTKWTERYEYYVTHTNVLTGVKTKEKVIQTIVHLDIELSGFLFEEWLDSYGNLDPSQKERYENILICGGAEILKCYGSPFIDSDWKKRISSRFGFRIDPFNGKETFHNGIDISMPLGTEIISVADGIAKVGYDPYGYGKYVTITYSFSKNSKISFLYAHCNTIHVVDGQDVKRGDIIATVGSTGKSTGSHLHLSYMIDGTPYNPEFYIE